MFHSQDLERILPPLRLRRDSGRHAGKNER